MHTTGLEQEETKQVVPAQAPAAGGDVRARRKAAALVEATREHAGRQRPTRQQINAYRELFYNLVEFCSDAELRSIAANLGSCAYTPRQVALYLALQRIETAAPILLFSPVINEADIAMLARRLPAQHLRVLARRDELSAISARALLRADRAATEEILLRNPRLSANPELARLLQRMPEAQAAPERQENSEAQAAGESALEEVLRVAGRGGRLGRKVAAQVRAAQSASPLEAGAALLEAARGGGVAWLSEAIATISGIRETVSAGILGERAVEPSAVLLKGLGVRELPALRILLLVKPELGRDREAYHQAAVLYRNLDEAQCRAFADALPHDAPRNRAEAESQKSGLRAVVERMRRAEAGERDRGAGHQPAQQAPVATARPSLVSIVQRRARAS
jgi:uncharacterized protein (DUF2336 family)